MYDFDLFPPRWALNSIHRKSKVGGKSYYSVDCRSTLAISNLAMEVDPFDDGALPSQALATQAYNAQADASASRPTSCDCVAEWYGGKEPPQHDIYGVASLEACRKECQQWAIMHGFNLVQKAADQKVGKAIFVCSNKGIKASDHGSRTSNLANR